jgi:prephenate dehydratase
LTIPESIASQHPRCVAFQGAAGAFSHEVIVQLWGADTPINACESFDQAVDALVRGIATHLVIPVSNTTIGPIQPAIDAIGRAPGLRDLGRVTYNVRHMLMALDGARLSDIRRVLSHPAALDQCRLFLSSLENVKVEIAFDTAGAAEFVARAGDRAISAIAPEGAARLYGLHILATDIQDTHDNATSFAVFTLGDE